MILRDYQQLAVDGIKAALGKHRSTLCVMATGCGKTILFADLIRRLKYGRAMVVVHRKELAAQARDKINVVTGCYPELEMGDSRATEGMFKAPIVVASVQTLTAGRGDILRMHRFDPNEFSLLILDEAHHSVAGSWKAVVDHFKQNSKLRIVGFTATPDRLDEKAMGIIFDSVAFHYDINPAIKDGWLVPVKQQFIKVPANFDGIKMTLGDLNPKQLREALQQDNIIYNIISNTIQYAQDRRTLVFSDSIENAQSMVVEFNRHRMGCANIITGETEDDVRDALMAGYRNGEYQFMVNVGIACLDDQTEILTSDGWIGCDRISTEYDIACWDKGTIRFSRPLAVEIRPRRTKERMVVLETKNRSIRVTEGHRMLYRTRKAGEFKVKTAGELVGKQCDLPICGFSDPFQCRVETPARQFKKTRLSANSYVLRKGGMGAAEAKIEAARRIERRDSLQHKQPSKLTLDECRWIGFWVGDGTRSRLQKGGVEYSVCGSDQWPKIAAWFEELSALCGLDFVKRRIPPSKPGRLSLTQWSFGRGTGFGPQTRRGVFPIEPYLKKGGSELWWSFSKEQFEAFLDGLWCADGNHLQETRRPSSIRIYGSNRGLLDLLQAIAVCRGYRANVQWKPNHGHVIGCLSLSRRPSHACTKFRLQFEDSWRPETVWCVKSETGFIVTRRRGTVTITGNTEGFDVPEIACVVQARPTLSRSLYTQMAGRGTRTLAGVVDGLPTPEERIAAIAASGKPDLLLLDIVGNSSRHKLVSALDILGGDYTEEMRQRAARSIRDSGMPSDVAEALETAKKEIRNEQLRKFAEAKGRAKLAQKSEAVDVDPFEGMTPYHRYQRGLCTEKMAKLLERFGYDDARGMSFEKAHELISEIEQNGWRRPRHEGMVASNA